MSSTSRNNKRSHDEVSKTPLKETPKKENKNLTDEEKQEYAKLIEIKESLKTELATIKKKSRATRFYERNNGTVARL